MTPETVYAAALPGQGSPRRASLCAPPNTAPRRAFIERAVVVSSFALLMFMNVALPSLKFGSLPLRAIVAVGMLFFLIIMYPGVARRALRQYLPLFGLATGLAALGIFVSFMNGNPLDVVVQMVIEVHLQAVVTVFVAAMVAEICGAVACVFAIAGVVAISALFAILQLFGSEAAWSARAALGPFPDRYTLDFKPLLERRPTGLSYSAIQLGNQLCLALAAVLAVSELRRRKLSVTRLADPTLLTVLLVFFAVSVASGTRSPILGGVVFFAFYLMRGRDLWLPALLLIGGTIVYFAWPTILAALSAAQPRVVSVDDNSAVGRLTLVYYGTRLFFENPLGYGFAFEASEHWMKFWRDLYTMPYASVVHSKDLHNYPLTMLNIYGIGLLLLLPLAFRLIFRASASVIFFVPYIVHVAFHNSAPFLGDSIFWLVIPAIAAAHSEFGRDRRDAHVQRQTLARQRLAPSLRRFRGSAIDSQTVG